MALRLAMLDVIHRSVCARSRAHLMKTAVFFHTHDVVLLHCFLIRLVEEAGLMNVSSRASCVVKWVIFIDPSLCLL